MSRILVIDDDCDFRETLCKVLQTRGYEVLAAENGKAGVEVYKNAPADLVITDVLMPEQDGIELIGSLRAITPGVKVILVSGGGKYGTAEQYLKSPRIMYNIKHCLTKPFGIDQMMSAVRELLP